MTCVPDLENTWNLKFIQKTWKTPGIVKFDIPGFSRSDFQIILCNIGIRKKFIAPPSKSNVACRLDDSKKIWQANLVVMCRSGFNTTSPYMALQPAHDTFCQINYQTIIVCRLSQTILIFRDWIIHMFWLDFLNYSWCESRKTILKC